jgi:hypothetical protein
MTTESPSPALLWKGMSEDQRLRAADAFWREADSADQQVEAMVLLAQKLKARPRYIATLPVEKKARHLAHYPGMPDVLAARLLVSYHLGHQRPMMAAFLDALGIVHDNGLINDDLGGAVPDDKLTIGAEALASAYPADDVRLYFETLLLQDPDTWGGLAPLARGA